MAADEERIRREIAGAVVRAPMAPTPPPPVPAASRNVFLDDVPTRDAVRRQLALAVRRARQQGFAIAIGHPHPATLQALAESLPQLEAHGVTLVFASELVR